MQRRALLAAGLALPSLASAQNEWPGNRPVRIIQPSQAGSPADVYARMYADHFARTFGGTFVVENRVGGTGSIGTAEVARAAPDGWTLLFTSNTSHVAAPLVLKSVPFDSVRDFTGIAGLYHYPMALIVTPSIPVRTTAEFVAWGKQRPEGVNMASVGIGSVGHMMAERFHLAAGFPRVHIPYRGGPSAILAVAQGESDYIFDNIGNSGMFAREGKLRFLSFTGRQRQKQMPDVPLLSEDGFPGLVQDVWFGVWGPANMPRPMVEKINAESNRWLASEAVRRRMEDGAHTQLPGTPEDFVRYWMEDLRGWTDIVRQTGIKME